MSAMSSLNQYIDLFEHNRRQLYDSSPEVFNRLRPAALSALERLGHFPGKRDEGYRNFSVDEVFAPDFGVNVGRVSFAVDVARTFRCDVPNLSTLLGVVVNDEFRPTATLLKNCPEGVTVMSLAEAARRYPDLVASRLGNIADNSSASTALNTLLLQDGVFVHIAPGVRLDKTIQIVNIFNASANLLSFRRVLVVVEDGASARLLMCDHTQSTDNDYLSSQVVEIFLGRGASLDYCDIEESSERTSRLSQMYVSQKADSNLSVNASSLTVGHTRNEYRVDLLDRGASAEIAGMAIAGGSQLVDSSTLIRHIAPYCHSNQLFKYLLDDNSRGAFEGLIYVAPDAVHTEAYQSDRNILASEGARMHTSPHLEIYCDDVKCSHGAATGQLDSQALFYMQTRGVPLAEARMMLMQAFMSDVIDRVRIDGLRDRLRRLVERRLNGDRTTCGDCAASCNK